MKLYEPATLLTDGALGLLAGALAWHLHRSTTREARAARWWAGALALTAASAFCGGAHHGFAPNFAPELARIGWTGTLALVCLTAAAMAMSLLHETIAANHSHGGPARPILRAVIGLKLIFAVGIAVALPKFFVVLIDYGIVLIAWAGAAIALHRPWRHAMLVGIALSILGGIVQQARWAPAAWFNHNDLYHVIQAGALIFLHRAGRRLSPATRAGP